MAEKIVCPRNLKWARAMVDLYPPGFSKKIDALRKCVEQAEKAKEVEKEEAKEEIKKEELEKEEK